MTDLQHIIKQSGQAQDNIEEEKFIKLRLKKWLLVEKSIVKQKSRVKWLQLGDGNIAYFHACLRNRYAHNRIASLTSIGDKKSETKREILDFYK